jgi:DNA-directed RNA polymerase subunit E'/Rpb7|tara:strand:+ start:226 stop:762 length:537 start_codon:yes stop_codon:yes gene_type:complete
MSKVIIRKTKKKDDEKNSKIYGVYMRSMLDKKVLLHINEIGRTLKSNLEKKISNEIAGKCIDEGFIKPNSIKVTNYSSGNIRGEYVEYQTVFECMICMPVEGMLIECVCKSVTKAGIHAEVQDEQGNIPLTLFIARDHHHLNEKMGNIAENDKLTARIIGIRFELNDKYICAIAKLEG